MEAIKRTSRSASSLFRSLQGLPVGLSNMYALTLQRIADSEDSSIAFRTFAWLIGVPYGLTTARLQEALSFDTETLEFDSLDFPEGISGSGILPRRLKRLIVTHEKALGPSQVLRLLDEVVKIDGLTELEEVQWVSSKFDKSSWDQMGIGRLEDWGMAHSIRIDARHYKH